MAREIDEKEYAEINEAAEELKEKISEFCKLRINLGKGLCSDESCEFCPLHDAFEFLDDPTEEDGDYLSDEYDDEFCL